MNSSSRTRWLLSQRPEMHPLAPSPPAVDDPAAPRLVLRDGTVASVRRATDEDRGANRADVLVDRLCDSADEQRSVMLARAPGERRREAHRPSSAITPTGS